MPSLLYPPALLPEYCYASAIILELFDITALVPGLSSAGVPSLSYLRTTPSTEPIMQAPYGLRETTWAVTSSTIYPHITRYGLDEPNDPGEVINEDYPC